MVGITEIVGSTISVEAKAREYLVTGNSSKELNLTNRKEIFCDLASLKPDSLTSFAFLRRNYHDFASGQLDCILCVC